MIAKGYKQTEIGVIPEDWKVKELDNVLKFGSGQDYKHLSKGDIPVYGTGGVMTFVNDYLYNGDSVGIGRKGTIDKPVFLSGKFWTVDTLFFTHSFLGVLPKFIYYNFLMIPWKEYNEASGVPSLNKNTLGRIKVPLPPTLKEQEAIAKVLTDTDNLIQGLEKVITKKKAIKKGAMQQLLTGKNRLKGYGNDNKYKQTEIGIVPEDWRVYKLGDVGDVKMCKRIFSYQTTKKGDIPFYKIGTFGKEPDAYIDKELYKEFRRKYPFPKKGYLLISASGTIGRTVEYNGEDAYYQDSNIIWLDNDENIITNEYLKYTLKVIKYNTEGSTIKRLYNSIIKSSIFVIPPTKEEQEAIATILSDMDKEIEALEVKKEKYVQLKKGLAQELLTGETRLV